MADLNQLLVATQILKSVIVGLFKPKGRKFNVTAKGGDRSKGFVQWPMLRIFLVYLGVTVAGVLWTFVIDDSNSLADASAMALFWSWYNIIVIVLACYVCIEASRPHRAERFNGRSDANLTVGNRRHRFPVAEISVAGARFIGDPPGPAETRVHIHIDGVDTDATIADFCEGGFTVRFAPSVQERADLIRHVYAGRYSGDVPNISPARVATGIVSRIFR